MTAPESVPIQGKELTPAVLQAADMLGLYGAELARILNVLCSDISLMANGKKLLAAGSEAWGRGVCFLEFYERLAKSLDENEAAMCHWLRAEHKQLKRTPLLEMVDHNGIKNVINCLDQYHLA